MSHAEAVVLTFRPVGEAAYASGCAQGLECFPPAGEYLVRVCLMAHVKDQLVLGGVEHIVERYDDFHGTEA